MHKLRWAMRVLPAIGATASLARTDPKMKPIAKIPPWDSTSPTRDSHHTPARLHVLGLAKLGPSPGENHETASLSDASRRRGSFAARGTCPAVAAHRLSQRRVAGHGSWAPGRVPARLERGRVRRGAQRGDRISLGGRRIRPAAWTLR